MTKRDSLFNSKIVSTKKVDVEVHSYNVGDGGVNSWDIWAMACKPAFACAPGLISAECKSINVMQMPGYGESAITADVESLTLTDYIETLDQVIDTNDGVLYGYSHSGYFMAQYALQRPEKVKALVLVEPALFTPKQELLDRIALIEAGEDSQAMSSMIKFVGGAQGCTDEQVDRTARTILLNVNSSSAVAREYRVRADNEVTEEALAALTVPVLLIGGTDSNISYMVKRAFQALPNAFVSWIDGATHLNLESGEYEAEFAAAINAFLQTVSAKNDKMFNKLMASVKAERVPEAEAEMAF
jgi:pimeloyl-ACP methyl ester carboxylesterase